MDNIQIDNAGEFVGKHTAIIQRLETYIPFWDKTIVPSGRVKYSLDNFTNTEQHWNQIPFIYIPKVKSDETIKHPNHRLLDSDPEAAAKSVKGYIAGWVSNSIIYDGTNGTGEPRLVGDIDFTCPIAEKDVNDGKVSISSGFDAAIGNNEDGGYISGKVRPSHILGFPRLQCKNCQANDQAAMFQNTIQEADNVTEVEIGNAVPPHTDTYGKDYTGRWRAPNLFNFTSKPRLSDLTEKQIRDIAAHFAYAREMPPKNFSDLKLGHHDPKKTGLGEVNRRGVLSAMAVLAGAMGGIDIPEQDKRLAYEHLKQHRIELGDKEEDKLPEFNNLISGEYDMTDEDIKEFSLDQESKGLFKSLAEKFDAFFEKQTNIDNTIENSDAPAPEPEADMTEMDNIKTELSEKVTEIDNLKAEMTEKESKIVELNNTVADLQGKLDEIEKEKIQAEKDAKWVQVKNHVPAGWLEDEEKARSEFEADPMGFAAKVTEHNNTIETHEAEGQEAIGNTVGASQGMRTDFIIREGKWKED